MVEASRILPRTVGEPWVANTTKSNPNHEEGKRRIFGRFLQRSPLGQKDLVPLSPQERSQVETIRQLRIPDDIDSVLKWASDPETRGHLDPAPYVPEDWSNNEQLTRARQELTDYYLNNGEPEKITALVAENKSGEPIGVVTIRWRGDPWVPKDERIASIERLIVNPEVRRKRIATRLVEKAADMAFNEYTNYKGNGAKEIRAWVMTDKLAGDYSRNITFFRGLGFDLLQHEKVHWDSPKWEEYKAKRNFEPEDVQRDAMWFVLKRRKWEEMHTIGI